MDTPRSLPVAVLRSNAADRRRRRGHRWRSRLPALAIGSALTVGILGANALVLAVLGGAFDDPPGCTLHGEGEKKIARSYEGSTICSYHYGGYYQAMGSSLLDGEDWEYQDPTAPSVPEIQTSWSTKPGSMTETLQYGGTCVYWQEGMFTLRSGAL